MAKSRVRKNKRLYTKKINDPKWPQLKKLIFIVLAVLASIVGFLAIVVAIIKYYRIVTK